MARRAASSPLPYRVVPYREVVDRFAGSRPSPTPTPSSHHPHPVGRRSSAEPGAPAARCRRRRRPQHLPIPLTSHVTTRRSRRLGLAEEVAGRPSRRDRRHDSSRISRAGMSWTNTSSVCGQKQGAESADLASCRQTPGRRSWPEHSAPLPRRLRLDSLSLAHASQPRHADQHDRSRRARQRSPGRGR